MSPLRRFALALIVLLGSLALLAGGSGALPQPEPDPLVEVVVTLPQPPLAAAILHDRQLAAATTTTNRRRLSVRTPAAVSYLRELASAQRSLQARIARAIPGASTRWHYGVVANGMAVVVPRSQLARLESMPGATVWPSVRYHSLLNKTPQLIGAPAVWGPTLATAGEGMKIAILDDGFDQTHVFFSGDGFGYPAGFPKGNTAYTTPKTIVARAFAPASPSYKYAGVPFDPLNSEHATNVAGIAAGDFDTLANAPDGKVKVSGIAPRAYLGNYKVLTIPTPSFGLDGNSPEIVAGIEAAVKDGMDVINLSIGEPEIEPSRDIVVRALNRAADAGVVPVVAAGNDAGRGTVGSPANASQAIAVAAATGGGQAAPDVIAGFSSGGPTPLSLEMKPDVTAPGVDLLSSLPRNQWSAHDWSGTSMAAPHVSGAVAVLKQRHPTWTPAQIKSALTSTGAPVHPDSQSSAEVATTREGGGRIDLVKADNPLVFTSPTGLSFGMPKPGTNAVQQLAVTDAGGGLAPWSVSVAPQGGPSGAALTVPPTVIPGTSLPVTLSVAAGAAEGEATGFVVLTRGTDTRRIPYWFRVAEPKLAREPRAAVHGAGLYRGNTAGKKSLVSTYRFPETAIAPAVPLNLSGPEQIFRLTVKGRVANIGAVVVSTAPHVRVSPRLVHGDDENRLTGQPALPQNVNPYQGFGDAVPAVGATLPAPGAYDIVFDTPARGKPGRFTFRVWLNDTKPPTVRRLPQRGDLVRFGVRDAGSGVDPGSIQAEVDGRPEPTKYANGVVTIDLSQRAAGSHRLKLVVSDYQESKNNENTGPILPNTRTVETTVVAG